MGRSKHPVTERIEDAIQLLERNNMEITPATIKVNAAKTITWADWTAEEAAMEALDVRIARCLRDRGYIITDTQTRTRKDFWSSTAAEFEAQIQIKEDSSDYDRARLKADKAVLVFLREKQVELGYPEVYPGLFHADIDRIYAMHGVVAP